MQVIIKDVIKLWRNMQLIIQDIIEDVISNKRCNTICKEKMQLVIQDVLKYVIGKKM